MPGPTDRELVSVLRSSVPAVPAPRPLDPGFMEYAASLAEEQRQRAALPMGAAHPGVGGPAGLLGAMDPTTAAIMAANQKPGQYQPIAPAFFMASQLPLSPLSQEDAAAKEAREAAANALTPTATPPGPAGMLDRAGGAMGGGYKMPVPTQEVLQTYGDLRKVLPNGPAAIGPVDQSQGNAAINLVLDSGTRAAAAKRAEAIVEEEGLKELSAQHQRTANYLTDEADEERSIEEREGRQISKAQNDINADIDWLRKNYKVDPYKNLVSNAGAGILSMLGIGLMATGAGLSGDGSLNWTKQISSTLDREADLQMQAVKNKQFAATEAGRNMTRLLETSRDRGEARLRSRAQHLAAAKEKLDAVKAHTESKAVAQKAEGMIAALDKEIGKTAGDLAAHREALEYAARQAELQAGVAKRGQDYGLMGTLAGNQLQRDLGYQQYIGKMAAPMREQLTKLGEGYNTAHTAGEALLRALEEGTAGGDELNNLAGAFVGASNTFLSGGQGTTGSRDEARRYGIPFNLREWIGKGDRYDAEGVRRMLDKLDLVKSSRSDFIQQGFYNTLIPPGSAVYHKGK